MPDPTIRLYADTSVFGGAFDEDFAGPSQRFLDCLRRGRFALVTSVLVRNEIADAPAHVRGLFGELIENAEVAALSREALDLRDSYLAAGIVSERWAMDALHVAVATVARCAVLVSWNFRHIVHFQKVPLYNAVSKAHGYSGIQICSPPEVMPYAEDDDR